MNNIKFLIEYWSQATVLLFAIGYILRVIFDFYIKKKEIKFNFIHKERAEVIKQLNLDIIELSKEIEFMALAHNLETINLGPTNQERNELVNKIIKLNGNIHETISKNNIYFPERFISRFDALVKNVNENIIFTSLDKNVIIKDDKKKYIFNNTQL